MFHKNLKYYRLKNDMTKKELAAAIGVTPMAITYYENGERKPDMTTIKALANVLGVRVTDFLNSRNTNLVFDHGAFRKGCALSLKQQEYVREEVEEYLNRFYTVLEILGGEILPEVSVVHTIPMVSDAEENARQMRHYLRIAENGPIGNLVQLLENKGILVYACDIQEDAFSGMNGFVNDRPYIIYNKNMTPERIRSTIVHELAHFMFIWPEDMTDKEVETMATAVGGAFLFPAEDVTRELGVRRTKITPDMEFICREYGVSMYLLVKRAFICNVITAATEKTFYIAASKKGWRKHEPVRIESEEPFLFELLVFRAVNEEEITIQKGAELLKRPYTFVAEHCFTTEG